MGEPELERYLHEHIPLSKAMAVEVVAADKDRVVLKAPLAPNINHRETLFGGSAVAIAILAAWSLVRLRLKGEGIGFRLVIRRNSMTYDLPVHGAFTARAFLDPAADWSRFVTMLKQYGMARIPAVAEIDYEGQVACRLTAEFVALSGATPATLAAYD